MPDLVRRLAGLRHDPRHYQIAILVALLAWGLTGLDFEVPLAMTSVVLAAVLATQLVLTRLYRLPRFDPRSPLISGLSLCLLLRTDLLAVAVLAALVTIASKFVLRRRGKHVFNPTNFGLVAMMLLTTHAWVSPSQWGSHAWLAFALAGIGGLVVYRSARSDVTVAFLLSYLAILFGRAAWLGDPMAIPLHEMQSGALLVFAFLMISDPKTTPDARIGRIVFAMLVAGVAGYIRFGLYHPADVIWALAICAPAVPLIDRLFPAARYEWPGTKGTDHAKAHPHEDARRPLGDPAHAPGFGLLRLLRRQSGDLPVQPRLAGGARSRR